MIFLMLIEGVHMPVTDAQLIEREVDLIGRANGREGNYDAVQRVLFADEAAVLRDALRYRAIRNEAKHKEGRVKVQAIFWHMSSRQDIDDAADALVTEQND